MATHYYKMGDTYFKLVDETREVISVTINADNKCTAMSIDNSGAPTNVSDEFNQIVSEGNAQSITQSQYEEKRDEVKQYITDNL